MFIFSMQLISSAISNYDQSNPFLINKPNTNIAHKQSAFIIDNLQLWDAKLEKLKSCGLLPQVPGMLSFYCLIYCLNKFAYIYQFSFYFDILHTFCVTCTRICEIDVLISLQSSGYRKLNVFKISLIVVLKEECCTFEML